MLEEMVARQPPSAGSRPVAIGSRSIAVSLQPAIPRRVAPQQSPLPLHRSDNSSSIPIRRGSQMRCSTSLQGCSPAFCCDRPVAPGTSAANGVSSLLCAPGDISILRRHPPVSVRGMAVFSVPVEPAHGRGDARRDLPEPGAASGGGGPGLGSAGAPRLQTSRLYPDSPVRRCVSFFVRGARAFFPA